MRVKMISTLFVLILSLNQLPAADVTVKIGEPSMKWEWGKDTVITIPVKLQNGPKLSAARVRVQFDSNLLTFLSVDKGASLKSGKALAGQTLNEPGVLTMNFASVDGVSGDGDLFLMKFSVIPSGIKGKTSSLEVAQGLAWNAENKIELAVETGNGQLTLIQQIMALPLMWLVGGGVGLLILLILLKRLFRRKKPAKTGTEQPKAKPASIAKKTPAEKASAGHFCTNCGSSLNETQKFCGECGTATGR